MKNFGDNIVYKIGIVVDVNDPLKLGRARVRLIGIYDDAVPIEHLPWALCVYPIGLKAIAPPLLGSSVLCWVVDDGFQQIIIVGELPGVKDGTTPDTPAIARNGDDIGDSIVASKSENKVEGEPESSYNTTYPNNLVIETPRGHFVELDDSEGGERIHFYHMSGSYIEIIPDGSIIIKSNGNSYNITEGSETKNVGSFLNITCPTVTVDGNFAVTSGATGQFTSSDGYVVTVQDGIITNIY